MTTIEFDLHDEQAAAGLAPASGHLACRYVNELDDPSGDGIVTTKPFRVDITNGTGTAEILPTPDGNALSVRSYVRGVRARTVLVPDSPTAVQFRDLTEVDPTTLAPAEPPAAWTVALNDAVANIIDAAPGALDTLNELAAALGDDANFATTVTNALAGKVATTRTVNGHALSADVTVTKADVGLGSADNTADADKPISTATQTALDGKVDLPDVDSWPIYVYGASYGLIDSRAWYTDGNAYLDQIKARLNAGTLTSYAVGGIRIRDVLDGLVNATAQQGGTTIVSGAKWDGTRQGLVVLDSMGNDNGHSSTVGQQPAAIGTDGRYLSGLSGMYRLALALLSTGTRVEQGSATYAGTWANQAFSSAPASNGTLAYSITVGANATFTVTPPQSGPLAGKVYLLTYRYYNTGTTARSTAAVDVSVDGGTATNVTFPQWEPYVGFAAGSADTIWDVIPATLPIDGAAHTVKFTHAGSAGQFFYVDALLIPSTDPNPIAVMGIEHPPAVHASGFTAAGLNNYLHNLPLVTAAVKAVTAEFPNAFYVPSTVTPNGIWSGDGTHLNDRGQTQRANDLEKAMTATIRARLESRRLSNLADGNFPIV